MEIICAGYPKTGSKSASTALRMLGNVKKMVTSRQNIILKISKYLTFTRSLRRNLRMRWVFDVSKVKESSFVNRTSLTPPQIFDAHLLENTNLSPSSFPFPVSFYIKICFETDGFIAYPNE